MLLIKKLEFLKEFKLINFASLLFLFIPISLLTGHAIPNILIVTISIIFLFSIKKTEATKYFYSSFFLIFIFFYLYINFISLLSEFPYHSLKSSIVYIRFGIFTLAVWFLIDKNYLSLKRFTNVFLFTFLFVLIDGYYQFFLDKSIFGFISSNPERLALSFSDKTVLGSYIARLMPLLIALIIYQYEVSKKLYALIAIILIFSDILVYLTGERTAIGLMIISTMLFIFLLSKYKYIRLVAVIISVFGIIILSSIFPSIHKRNIQHTAYQIGLDTKDKNINLFSIQHESHFKSALKMFNQNKIIGIGPNNFRKLCSEKEYNENEWSCSTHPHNLFIQLLAETGFIGFSIIFAILIKLSFLLMIHFKKLWIDKKSYLSDFKICLIICFILTLFPGLPSMNFFNSWINVIYYLPVGFFLYDYHNSIR